MEEATVDVALDPHLVPSERALQANVQTEVSMDNRDQARFLASIQKGRQTTRRWLQSRAARVESLRQSVASGNYQTDNAGLALCLLRNSTHFFETCQSL